jgi:hypothetical protein
VKKEWSTPALEILEVKNTYKFVKDPGKWDKIKDWWEEYCEEIGTGPGES